MFLQKRRQAFICLSSFFSGIHFPYKILIFKKKKLPETKNVRLLLLYLICRGTSFTYKIDKMKKEYFFKLVCTKTKQISKGRYTCKIECNSKFGDYIYVFDNLSLINPKIGYSTNNIKKWFSNRVLGYNFGQEELGKILYDEEGKQLKVKNAAKALIEAFKYINAMYKDSF